MSFLEIRGLDVTFGQQRVLKHIDLDVAEGELVTFLGPSGCGKSTLMRTIAGLEKARSGQVFLDGKDITNLPSKSRSVGMVFQHYALFPNMTVAENIAFGLKVQKKPAFEIRQAVDKMLDLLDLKARSQHYPNQLSGGQKQRVALGRALIVAPKLLLLDEPLSALDAKIRKQIQQDLKRLQKELGITMIFVTHDQDEAMILSDRVHIMQEGSIIQSASPQVLYQTPKTPFVASFIGAYNYFDYQQMTRILPQLAKNGQLSSHFAVRPERLQLETYSDQDYMIPVQFDSLQFLGNVVRVSYRAAGTMIHQDCLNDHLFDEARVRATTRLYLSPDALISYVSEARA